MSYYHFNRQYILLKPKENSSKKKATQYCITNKKPINEKIKVYTKT